MEPDDTQADRLRFDEGTYGGRQPWIVHHRGLEYRGEVIVSVTVNPELGQRLDRDVEFRVVFFTMPRRIPFDRISDPRIAMAVPLRAPDERTQTINRQIKSVKESRARYFTRSDADTLAMRQSMDEQENSLQRELGHGYMTQYSRGRIYTQSGFTLRTSDIYLDDRPESWANRLAKAVLDQSVPEIPFDHSNFPQTLTDERIASLYRGLFQGDQSSASIVRDYGPGLRLTPAHFPDVFDGSDSPVLSIIGDALESRGGEMLAQDVIDLLVVSHGLTLQLAALYMVAFVRQRHAEIELVEGHVVARYGGGLFRGGSITWDVVPEITFDGPLIDNLGVLRLEPALSWNAALPYASLIVAGLEPAADDALIAIQERALLDGLNGIASRAGDMSESLRTLATGLDGGLQEGLEAIDSLLELSSASDYGEFYTSAQRLFGEPSALAESLDTYASLARLAEQSSEIVSVRGYLDGMVFGREHQQLSQARDNLAAMIEPSNLMTDTLLWGSISDQFVQFRNRYVDAYVSHHTRYNQEALELGNRMERVGPQIEALARFNEMPELGDPVGKDVPELAKSVESSLKTCAIRQGDLSLQDAPYCPNCLLTLDEDVPRYDAETLFGAVERAMRVYNRRLGSFSARRVLAQPSREQLDRFVSLVQVADPSALVNVLDDDVIEFLRQFLNDGSRP